MKNNNYVIGISSIGSGIGQAIIHSCRLSNLPLLTIGFGNNPYAFGMYDCDSFEMIPSIQEEAYISTLIQKSIDNKVDILIPSHDFEIELYSKNQENFSKAGIHAIVSGKKLVQICSNKESMSDYFGDSNKNIFVKTYKIEDLINSEEDNAITFPLISKPRIGYGSKNIRIVDSIDQIKTLPSEFILQELALPAPSDLNYLTYINSIKKSINRQVSEISVQLVADNNGHLIGRMASYNRLDNGGPIEILPVDLPVIWNAIDSIAPQLVILGFKGPLNIQGRVTEQGFKIFEMNPRFTHMTGLRALMGFNEVDACIKSWLNLPIPPISVNFNRFGIRQARYRAVEIKRNEEVQRNFLYINKIPKRNNDNLLITGANDFAREHLLSLLQKTEDKINVLTWNKGKERILCPDDKINFVDYRDLNCGNFSFGGIDTIIHLGFSKRQRSYWGIVAGMKFTSWLFRNAVLCQVPAIINVSSQSIYGTNRQISWKETDRPSLQIPHAHAMFATELMLSDLSSLEKQVRGSSLRLSALSGGDLVNDSDDVIWKIVNKVVNMQPIILQGGNRLFEILDVRDAAKAIVLLLNIPAIEWKPIYNVGSGKVYSLTEIASEVLRISNDYVERYPFELPINDTNKKTAIGMNSSLFIQDVGWSPEYDLQNIIHSLFQRNIKNKKYKDV
jgi:nucleoside-diphosphate-sugar epimerase